MAQLDCSGNDYRTNIEIEGLDLRQVKRLIPCWLTDTAAALIIEVTGKQF